MKHALIACCCLTTSLSALEVHEWGTFTVLSGSNGHQIPWYSPFQDIAKLPDFVHPGMFGKGGQVRIRMETPVIYFYPKERMNVAVEARFANGSITETFPYSIGGYDASNGMIQKLGKWTGTLHPPDDKNALSHIPVIKESNHEEPYGAAREVPDAWIFESDVKEIPGLKKQPRFPEMEKFIFYRGAGNASLPIYASMQGNQVTLPAQEQYGIALRVRGNKAAWIAIPTATAPLDQNAKSIIDLPNTLRPLDEIERELAAVWKSALANDGLTPAEASAMVETWRKTWFREEGNRILTLIPRTTIDAILPLKVTPQPTKTERVFVARIEMISPEREQALIKILIPDQHTITRLSTSPIPIALRKNANLTELRELALGRFESGAVEIAIQRMASDMRNDYFHLKTSAYQVNQN